MRLLLLGVSTSQVYGLLGDLILAPVAVRQPASPAAHFERTKGL